MRHTIRNGSLQLATILVYLFGEGVAAETTDAADGRQFLRHLQQQQRTTTNAAAAVVTLELLQASTGNSIATIDEEENDSTAAIAVSSSEMLTDLTVVAKQDAGDDNTSFVKFVLTRMNNNAGRQQQQQQQQSSVYKKYEGRAPYALCGKVAKSGEYVACDANLLLIGQKYKLSVQLSTGVTIVRTFRLVVEDPNEVSAAPAITYEYDLIDTSASPQRVIYSNMPSNAKVYKSTYNVLDDDTQLTLSVRPASSSSSSSTTGMALKFDNGHVEGQSPYSYCGDTAGVYKDCFAVGSTTRRTIAFSVLSSQGKVIDQQSFTFTLVDDDFTAPVDNDNNNNQPENEDGDETAPVPSSSTNGIVPAGSWQLDSNLPISARHEACFVWVNRKGYLLGGRRSPPTDIYDSRTNTWSQGRAPPIDLHHMQCVVVDETAQIWIVAAWTGSYPRDETVEDIYIYDTDTDRWSTKPGLPTDRRRGSAAVVMDAQNQRIYVSHGSDGGHATSQNTNVVVTGYLDYYDLALDEWVTNLPDAPHPRDHTGGAFLQNRYVCVAGGRDGSVIGWPAVLATDCFDTVTMRWTTSATDLPAPRSGSSYGTSCNGRYLLLAGGEMGDNVFADVYAFDGTTWTTLSNSKLRTARHGSSLGMDCECDRVFLASGSGGPRGGPQLTSMEVLGGDGSC